MRTKENKGVTLIALAVTVIVLLIISGVTISYMTGENGIINQSKESKKFWKTHYSEIDTIENKIALIKDEGYEFIDYFILPKSDFEDYYANLESNLRTLDDNDFKKDFKKEIEVYGNNSSDYSYVYYIMKKEVRQ